MLHNYSAVIGLPRKSLTVHWLSICRELSRILIMLPTTYSSMLYKYDCLSCADSNLSEVYPGTMTCFQLSLLFATLLVLTSGTPIPQGQCVSSCAGVANGDYQSCNGCNVYVTCSNGIKYDNRPCPASLVWDDFEKRCEYTSDTCPNLQGKNLSHIFKEIMFISISSLNVMIPDTREHKPYMYVINTGTLY